MYQSNSVEQPEAVANPDSVPAAAPLSFSQLELAPAVTQSLAELGYEAPTPIQAQSIPVLLQDQDLLAQAQTGTGKTAAFALPILSKIDLSLKAPQALILAPTRELAIQVAEAFQRYAKHLKGFHVLPIYGGQDYRIQLKALQRGAQVIVGTPGRLMDHLERGKLSGEHIKSVVLDEADEMLRMGFINDVEWILSQIPNQHTTALFSATLPKPIQKIAERYLKDAQRIHIEPKQSTVSNIEQFYCFATQNQKLEVLTRFLDVEDVQAAIIFTRTKISSDELAEKLQARGFAAAALNGDMNQTNREKVIGQLRRGALDIVIATDVAARGIDVERVSHVINYDIPADVECYIHRIGRTGRAGRQGKAILFVTSRERRLLSDIERTIQKPIQQLEPPTILEMKQNRSRQLAEKIIGIVEKSQHLDAYREMLENIIATTNCTTHDIAAALLYLQQQDTPLPTNDIAPFKDEPKKKAFGRKKPSNSSGYKGKSKSFGGKNDGKSFSRDKKKSFDDRPPKKKKRSASSETLTTKKHSASSETLTTKKTKKRKESKKWKNKKY